MPELTPDSPDSDFIPSVADGAFGRFAIDAQGDWTYVLSPPATCRLNAGQQAIERFDVRRKDGSVATVAITVVGDADDEGVRPPLRLRDKALPA